MTIYIVQNYITNVPTCFGAPAPSSGSFDVVFSKVINDENYTKPWVVYGKMYTVDKILVVAAYAIQKSVIN